MGYRAERRKAETGLPGIITNDEGLIVARYLHIDEGDSEELGNMALELLYTEVVDMKEV